MTKSRLKTLACFTETWRSLRFLMGVRDFDVGHLPYLLTRGLVEEGYCIDYRYRITERGKEALAAVQSRP